MPLLISALVVVPACSSSTEPKPRAQHPVGAIAATVPVGLRPYGISLSGGVAIVTQLDGGRIVRLNADEGLLLDSVRVGNVPTDVTYLADANSAAVTNQADASVGFLDFGRLQQTTVVAGPSSTFRVLQSKDGRHLYATASSGSVGVIALPSHSVEAAIGVGGAPNGLALSPDGRTLYVTAVTGGISVVNTASNTVVRTIPLAGTLQDIAVSGDGRELYVASESGNVVYVLDAASGSVKTSIDVGAPVFGLSLTPDNAQLYATSPEAGMVWIIDRASRAQVKALPIGGTPRRIAFDEAGTRAVVSNEAGFVTVID
jgi:YVTN family beta-propeller protein